MGIDNARVRPMGILLSQLGRVLQPASANRQTHGTCAVTAAAVLLLAGAACARDSGHTPAPEGAKPRVRSGFYFPTVPPEHKHVRALLANAMRYAAPENRITDPVSGYPFEGWNHDPQKGLFLRSFTQLTAIGLWMELLANVAAGEADTPYLSRENALSQLSHLVKNLRQDQRDPHLGAQGLLGNFLDLASGKRLAPLASDVDKQKFLDEFGREKGEAIWKALQARGWIVPGTDGREAAIERGGTYGSSHFDGALTPYRDDATRQKIMAILDQRVVQVVFGDNANLSASVAKTIGTLLGPEIKDRPEVVELRRELERFLEDQRGGYVHLYDAKAGLFYFGWDASRDRLFGWADLQGKWQTGHVDYLVNEFRGPATFVVVRYGLPREAIENLGFKMKPYRMRDGREVYVLAPWDGSAFQALGLGLWLMELTSPSWRTLLENAVAVEIDYAYRKKLPGFLSESYTGEGTQYTGAVGIPDITVAPKPRITDAASLYTLGPAYTIAPAQVDEFLGANWSVVSKLLTDHGPWEGFNVTTGRVTQFQTSAHTLALILGLLGTESEHMKRYLESRDLGDPLAQIFKPGAKVDLLADDAQVFAWTQKDAGLQSKREKGAFHLKGAQVKQVGIAFVSGRPDGVNLSGGLLSIRYRSSEPIGPAIIALKPLAKSSAETGLIPNQIFTHFADTGGREEEIQVPLPATPGLAHVKEVVITYGAETEARATTFSILRCECTPIGPAGVPLRPKPSENKGGVGR
jgi:hypothetical protein